MCIKFNWRNRKTDATKFLTENPDAAKVFMQIALNGEMKPISVNNTTPKIVYERSTQGVLVFQGENVIEVQFSWTMPSITYKKPTATVVTHKINMIAEANEEYMLSFDKKEKCFRLEKLKK